MEEVRWTARIRQTFLAGLLALVPATLTVAVLVWLFRWLDGLLGPALTQLTGRQIPGLGLLATVILVFLLGLVSRNVIGRRLVGLTERIVQRVPVVRTLYGSTKEVVSSIADRPAQGFKSVALFEYPRRGVWSIGFVTGSVRPQGVDLPAEDLVTIFVPTAPIPTTGFLLLVPRADVREISITVEQAVRLMMSGGILRPAAWSAPAPDQVAGGAHPPLPRSNEPEGRGGRGPTEERPPQPNS